MHNHAISYHTCLSSLARSTCLARPREAILDTLLEGHPRQGYFLARHRRPSNIRKVVYGPVRPSETSSVLELAAQSLLLAVSRAQINKPANGPFLLKLHANEDINEAIKRYRESLRVGPQDHPERHTKLLIRARRSALVSRTLGRSKMLRRPLSSARKHWRFFHHSTPTGTTPTSGYARHICLVTDGEVQSCIKSLPLSKLRRYVDAYNIPVKGRIDKNDLVDSIIAAKSIPLYPCIADFFQTPSDTRPPPPTQQQTSTSPPDFPRPDVEPQPASYTTYTPEPPIRRQTTSARPPSPPPPPLPQTPPRPAPLPLHAHLQQPTLARLLRPSTPPTPQPPPPLSTLLAMSPSSLSRLPIHMLKQILFEARVCLPTDILEKEELVARVGTWLDEERAAAEERDRIEREEREQEEWGRRDRERAAESSAVEADAEDAHVHGPEDPAENVEMHDESQHHHSPSSSSPQPSSPPRMIYTERSGLCVICQDQEANIAIVDCGHLSTCRTCSELVLASSRERPLCRTRIVTEARLLRIFKT
ncbi:uncharacterized protein EDB91DRAFT_1340100 [Suillus paluster]|uniref:uncharacterized protein n=1 Tax=Suillus paluster TaxID=48578 RepID=UPI001B87CDB6|nr:uncharacterized protein EDB91DRAFT_1340100 [Suillus paluster]KAG1724216.1 hypothetical protein EDB91DRAFT_1340100 [Suillus paluster]